MQQPIGSLSDPSTVALSHCRTVALSHAAWVELIGSDRLHLTAAALRTAAQSPGSDNAAPITSLESLAGVILSQGCKNQSGYELQAREERTSHFSFRRTSAVVPPIAPARDCQTTHSPARAAATNQTARGCELKCNMQPAARCEENASAIQQHRRHTGSITEIMTTSFSSCGFLVHSRSTMCAVITYQERGSIGWRSSSCFRAGPGPS